MTNMRYVIFEDNLLPLSEPVVHRKCVCSAGEKEKQQKSHLEGKRSKQKTPKEKSTIKNSRTLFLPICQVLYDVTWSAENPELPPPPPPPPLRAKTGLRPNIATCQLRPRHPVRSRAINRNVQISRLNQLTLI